MTMTYEKRAEQYCKNCKEYNLCIWVKQKRYSNCIDGQNFMAGWECGQSDTLEEIEKAMKECDVDGSPFVAILDKIKELKQQ